jgi:uncharacterized membrane protein YukC
MPKDDNKADEPKYGATDLAEALGVEPATVRVLLRASDVKKSGSRYGWNTKKEFDEVVKTLNNLKKERAERTKGDAAERMAQLRAAKEAKKKEAEAPAKGKKAKASDTPAEKPAKGPKVRKAA